MISLNDLKLILTSRFLKMTFFFVRRLLQLFCTHLERPIFNGVKVIEMIFEHKLLNVEKHTGGVMEKTSVAARI